MPDAAADSPEPDHENSSRYDETLMHAPTDTVFQQAEDIALVAELLDSGLLSERQIASAMADWSIHGSVPLSKHIQNRGLLPEDKLAPLMQRVQGRIVQARKSAESDSVAPASGDSLFLATLDQLDGTGRVSKLLGVTVAAISDVKDERASDSRYQLIRKLGQGGLGRVWLARDLNLNRYVALKEISHPARATEATIHRFKHEAEITGRLEHPGIVPVYHLGKDQKSGRAFYAMRFLGKQTLQDSITEYHERREEGDHDPMLLRHLLGAFVNICHALGHAHSRKVIHRDLKPENIVIDSFGQVIVIDWGLAKILDETFVESLTGSTLSGEGASQTNEGQVLGTPLFMAPEQAAGRLDEVDTRTDIYGLGSILFAIITGYAPHEETQKAAVSSGVGARGMISVIASGETPLARKFNPSADPALEAICAKAMARRRYARYQDAAELAEEVQRWMAGESVSAYEETSLQQVKRWIGRHQGLSQALAAMIMVVLVALTTLGMAARQNYVDVQQAEFNRMQGDVREVELQLRGVASSLAKDARFIASLPPVQGIISARAGVEGDDEEVWRGRLESIYSGLLRSNPDYLALSFVAMKDRGTEEIVRVERNPSDPSYLASLPAGRLFSTETDELMQIVAPMLPSDVKMTLDPRPRFADGSDTVKRLTVATPLYSDLSGEIFGMALIESDITTRIEELLQGLGGVDCEVFICEGSGEIWASANAEDGVRTASPGKFIDDLPAELAQSLSEEGVPLDVSEEYEYVAKRMYVDPKGRGVFIFARLPEDD